MSADWRPPGYRDREEWLEDRYQAAMDRATWLDRLARWWWINRPAVATMAVLAAVLAVLVAWAVTW